jgi:HEPN domain-containing protein
LLHKAEEDAITLGLAGLPDGPFGFHVQQAIEKLLKALLCQLQIDYRFTHDLEQLVLLLRSAGIEIPEPLLNLGLIGHYAVAHRYDDIPEFLVLDRNAATATVRQIREFVHARIHALSKSNGSAPV